jgi:hypothetical protein
MDTLSQRLYQLGLNLQASFKISGLPDELRKEIVQQHPTAENHTHLSLLGNAGSVFWQNMCRNQPAFPALTHPLDKFFMDTLRNLLAEDVKYEIIYPGNHFLPLQGLGKLAGWHHPSPLGLSIHPEYGLWFAYRGLVLSDKQLIPPAENATRSTSACDRCAKKPCISSCPAAAVTAAEFRVQHCSDFRLVAKSPCEKTCISRLACPIARQHQYVDDQLAYHYGFSLSAIKKYQAS